jgi:8-hydroxy-5-deazaflavin:NADPH oxidoreductase
MKIGIIGAGKVGTGLGKRLAAKGHGVIVSFARSPERVKAASEVIGNGATAGTPEEAVRFADVVIIATPWAATLAVVKSIAASLSGKILWDATSPLKADMSGLEIGTTTSGGEAIGKAASGARVVKAIPPFAEILHSPSTLPRGSRSSVFVCGDDADARATVLELVADIDTDGVDTGPLMLARYTEPLGMLLVQLAYVRGFGAHIGAALIRDLAHLPPSPSR